MKKQRVIITLAVIASALMGMIQTGCGSVTATEESSIAVTEQPVIAVTEEPALTVTEESAAVSEAEVKTLLADPILSWYPGTAGSSLKLAVVAADVLSFASQHDRAEKLCAVWNELPEEEQLRFAENVEALSELIGDIRSDYASVSGLCEDAGVAEKLDGLFTQKDLWEKWDTLHWQLQHPFVELGSSVWFPLADRQSAAETVLNEFSGWEGCVMHRLWYTSDDESSKENLAWMNELAAANGLEPDFAECIHFRSNFHSPVEPGEAGAWNPDEEYENWGWWLARTEQGEWRLMTWGWP